MIFEVCVDSVESALNAYNGGADRIELCSALCLGGLTPSVGFLRTVKKLIPSSCPIFVMIRPKPGEDYMYNDDEIQVMKEDIKILKENGADGFVFGCLNKERDIDISCCSELLKEADNYPCTFHRAYDVVNDPEESLLKIINLGFHRILTSGQEKTALLGKNFIKNLVLKVNKLGSQLVIMAGGGIDVTNLEEILQTTKVLEFHGSARANSFQAFNHKNCLWTTNKTVVREMISIAKKAKIQH